VRFIDALPKSTVGKILRRELRDLLATLVFPTLAGYLLREPVSHDIAAALVGAALVA
jgi:hypothetical protein